VDYSLQIEGVPLQWLKGMKKEFAFLTSQLKTETQWLRMKSFTRYFESSSASYNIPN